MNQKYHDALETIIAEVKKEVAKENYELGYTIGLDDAWACARMLVDISTYVDGFRIASGCVGSCLRYCGGEYDHGTEPQIRDRCPGTATSALHRCHQKRAGYGNR